jgi:thiol-disulfide isomerase/thioredoxin
MVLAAVVFMAARMTFAQGADTESLKGKQAPDFTLKTLTGETVKLSDQKGKVVLVDMWATWCPPCRKSLPHIQEISANKDLAEKGLVVWAVNFSEETPEVQKFVKDNKYTFVVPMDKGEVGKNYLVQGIPTTVIVGKDGNIKEEFIGFAPATAAQIDAAVKSALAEK